MAKTEKIAFILEQVRLCLARKDFIRCTSHQHVCKHSRSTAPGTGHQSNIQAVPQCRYALA